MVARTIPVEPFDLVVFGGTGDLARRKLLPSLYHRFRSGQIPPDSRVIAASRSALNDRSYKALGREALEQFVSEEELDVETAQAFLDCLEYLPVDAESGEGWSDLTARLGRASERVRAFYLSVSPDLFGTICDRLASSGIATASSRVVVEKPLGHDVESARSLNSQLAKSFAEHQLYRIDHYLGKETVQNLMAIRFANALFEPLWNGRHVDHVQITVAESIGVEKRGSYYDRVGAMRDMIQNHLMQLLCLTAMEPPSHFEPDSVRDEKLKVIRALEPIAPERIASDVVRGQYRGGSHGSSYLEDVDDPNSRTESFVALKVQVANWRWSGTPFYMRTGKRLRAQMSEIAVIFRDPPHSIFPPKAGDYRGNALIIRLQPDEGITLRMTVKEPGPGGIRLIETPLDMTFAETLSASNGGAALRMPDAYERLIMDVIRGDQTLFMRRDEVEAAWAWVDPIIAAWKETGQSPEPYDCGGSGPENSLRLMHRDDRRWREIGA